MQAVDEGGVLPEHVRAVTRNHADPMRLAETDRGLADRALPDRAIQPNPLDSGRRTVHRYGFGLLGWGHHQRAGNWRSDVLNTRVTAAAFDFGDSSNNDQLPGGVAVALNGNVGVIGALLGGWLFGLLGLFAGGLLGSLIVATVGAIVFLFLVRLIKRV